MSLFLLIFGCRKSSDLWHPSPVINISSCIHPQHLANIILSLQWEGSLKTGLLPVTLLFASLHCQPSKFNYFLFFISAQPICSPFSPPIHQINSPDAIIKYSVLELHWVVQQKIICLNLIQVNKNKYIYLIHRRPSADERYVSILMRAVKASLDCNETPPEIPLFYSEAGKVRFPAYLVSKTPTFACMCVWTRGWKHTHFHFRCHAKNK